VERSVDAHLSPEELDVALRARSGSGASWRITEDSSAAEQHLAICEICRSTIEFHAEEEGRMRNMRSGVLLERVWAVLM